MPVMVGFDPGRDSSFGALVVLEQHLAKRIHPNELPPDDPRSLGEILGPLPPPTYTLRFLRRFPQSKDMTHPMMVNQVVEAFTNPQLPLPKHLLVDASGLGGHYATDLFTLARVQVKPVVWTGGLSDRRDGDEWHVGKARMVAALLAMVEARRVKMNPEMPFAAEMMQEMRQYLREQNPETGREIFHAPRTGAHDDLISATLMCAWWGERFSGKGPLTVPLIYYGGGNARA